MRFLFVILAIALLTPLVLRGCTDSEYKKAGEHVWKEKTDTIKKADEVNQLILDATKKKKQDIEKQLQ